MSIDWEAEEARREMDYREAVHTYEPDKDGRCTSGWHNGRGEWVKCLSTQRSSVLHDDPASDFRAMHDHGGYDCMCFEDPDGPSFWEAMHEYVEGRKR